VVRASAGGHGDAGHGEITIEMLRQTFPRWRIFQTGGTWWAIRGGVQTWDGPRSLLLRSLTGPGLMTLAERLCRQEWLDGLDDDALETVYRGDVGESAP
jgi:hypothetical protein